MEFKVGEKFINTRNNYVGYLIHIDNDGYTFQHEIQDFFTESYNPVCIKITTISKVQLMMFINDGIINLFNV